MKPITNRSPRPGKRAKDTCRPQVGQRRLDPAAVWCSKEEAAIPVRGGRGRVDAPFRSVRPAGRPRLPLPASTEAEDGRSEGTPRWVDMGFRSRDSGYSSRTGAARPRQAGGRRARARRRCERRVRACVRPRGRDGDLQAPRWPSVWPRAGPDRGSQGPAPAPGRTWRACHLSLGQRPGTWRPGGGGAARIPCRRRPPWSTETSELGERVETNVPRAKRGWVDVYSTRVPPPRVRVEKRVGGLATTTTRSHEEEASPAESRPSSVIIFLINTLQETGMAA
jgi:hypothetical protein